MMYWVMPMPLRYPFACIMTLMQWRVYLSFKLHLDTLNGVVRAEQEGLMWRWVPRRAARRAALGTRVCRRRPRGTRPGPRSRLRMVKERLSTSLLQ